MINLEKPEEELWKDLEKKSARWGAKTAEKNGLTATESTPTDLKEIFNLYKDTADKGGLKPEPFEFFEAVDSLLVPKKLAKFFTVKQGSAILAGGLLLIDTDHTMVHLTGANDKGYKLQAMPFLYWNLIKFSKEIGKKYLDMGGYDTEARQGEKAYQINKFKKNFGGEIQSQPIYATSGKYITIRKLMKKLRFLKKIYKKSRD